MGLRINTNMASLSAQKMLGVQQKKIEHSIGALSSGSRIVKASDDAAGLMISEGLKGQIRGMAQAKNNASNAESVLQISEGSLNEINNILIRLRELGIQAASDSIGDTERGFIQQEAQQLIQESDRIAKTAKFGSRQLLDGSGGEMQIQVGTSSGPNNRITLELNANATSDNIGISDIDLADKDGARDSLDLVDAALVQLGSMRANFGALQNRLLSTVSSLETQYENLSSANSRIRDTDIAKESADLMSANILQQSTVAVLAQANQVPGMALKLIA